MPRKKDTEPEVTLEPKAGPTTAANESGESVETQLTQVIVFAMDGQTYALPIEAVQEIQQIVDYTAVRGTDPALIGMVDLRGTVVPLVDLRRYLGLTAAPYHLDTPLVFAHLGERLVALVVDRVDDVVDLSGVRLQAPSSLYALYERLIGVARMNDGLLFVLDPDRLVPAAALVPRKSRVKKEKR